MLDEPSDDEATPVEPEDFRLPRQRISVLFAGSQDSSITAQVDLNDTRASAPKRRRPDEDEVSNKEQRTRIDPNAPPRAINLADCGIPHWNLTNYVLDVTLTGRAHANKFTTLGWPPFEELRNMPNVHSLTYNVFDI